MSDDLFETNRYEVIVVDTDEAGMEAYTDGRFMYTTVYAVVNKETGVWEHVGVQYPEACFAAKALTNAVDAEPWNYVGRDTMPPPGLAS